MSAFRAFFDESGTERRKHKAFIMGGFLGRVDDWLAASDAWDKCLHHVPRIEYFKHSEMQSLTGEFNRWKRKDADAKMLALAKVISLFPLLGFCAIAPHALIRKKPVKRGLVGSRIYDWGFHTAVKMVLQYMTDRHSKEKVDFVFDEHTALKPNIDFFDEMKNFSFLDEYLACAGTCHPGEDKKTAALQMADLLAAEFLRMADTNKQSESFVLIRERNTIAYMRCDPPWQHTSTLHLFDVAASLRSQCGIFLKQEREGSITQEEALNQFLELVLWESYFHKQKEQLRSQLEADQQYQTFRKRMLASSGIDPMKALIDKSED